MLNFPTMDLDRYQGFLVDLDNTLYPFAPAHTAALKATHAAWPNLNWEQFIQTFDQTRTHLALDPTLQSVCRSRTLIFQNMLYTQKVAQPHNLAHTLEMLYWQTFLEHMTPCQEAMMFLKQAHAAGKPICIVTDMQIDWQIQKLECLGALPYIDHLVTSEGIGAEKPSAKIYWEALDRLQCQPTEVAMIGDHPDKDIIGAEALGIDAYQVTEVSKHPSPMSAA